MPEYPHNARLLNPTERDYAVWRLELEAGAGEAHEDTSTLGGFKQAMLDPKIWAMVWCMGMSQAMGSTINFFPSIVETLGYGRIQTMLLTAPPFVFGAILIYIISWISDVSLTLLQPEKDDMANSSQRKHLMYMFIMGCLCISLVAYAISMGTLSIGGRYFAMMIMPIVCGKSPSR